jgi:DNA ligase D-like protein (predicted ligase)
MALPRRRRIRPSIGLLEQFPTWVEPQLTRLVEQVPEGDAWAHEIKFDGYRIHTRIEAGQVRLLTRTGLDWTDRYPATAAQLAKLSVQTAYIDGELCAVAPNGVTSFSLMQAATDARHTAALIYFAFDLLYLDGENLMAAPLLARKQRLQSLLNTASGGMRYVDHQIGKGELIYQHASRMMLEGIVSKQVTAP